MLRAGRNRRNVLSVQLWTDVIDVTPPGAEYAEKKAGALHAALVVPIPIWLWFFLRSVFCRVRQAFPW